MRKIICGLIFLLGLTGTASAQLSGVQQIQNGGVTSFPNRTRLNFVNGGCVDNPATAAKDCTIAAGGGTLQQAYTSGGPSGAITVIPGTPIQFTLNGIGGATNVNSEVLSFVNATAATNTQDQYTGSLHLIGQYWTGAASATDDWWIQGRAGNGLTIGYSAGGAAQLWRVDRTGLQSWFGGVQILGGNGNIDLSGSSGTFLTPTGDNTFGGSSNRFTNAVSVLSSTNQFILGSGGHIITVSSTAPAAAAWTLTMPDPTANDSFAYLALAQTLTNKTISGASNTLSNIGNGSLTNSSITFANGTGITGGATVSLGGTYTPAIDQTFTPTWTGLHTWSRATTTAQTVFASFATSSTATVGAQKYSGLEEYAGSGWGTTGSAAQAVKMGWQMIPIQGTTPTASLGLYVSLNGGAYAQRLLFDTSSTTGVVLKESTGGNSKLVLDNTGATQLIYGNANITIGTGSAWTSAQTNATGNDAVYFNTFNAMSAAGMADFHVYTSNVGTYMTIYSGDALLPCAIGRDMLVDTAGITTGKVVVYSAATGKVSDAGATNNLATVAGVALTTTASGSYGRVCIMGPAKVNADAGIALNDQLVTSSGAAGNVKTNNAPTVGTVIGRAMEATGAHTANMVYVDVHLY